MRRDTALKILALKKPIAALGVKELKALMQYKKENVMELYQLQRRISWEGMMTSVTVQIKHLRRICQAFGINNFTK